MGQKLPLFVIFKAQPNGPIEQSLPELLPAGMYGCCQEKGWMDNRSMEIWRQAIWAPYTANSPWAYLLLDRQENHIHPVFASNVEANNTFIAFVPGGQTSVSQPADVGVNFPLKTRLRKKCCDWKVLKYAEQGGVGKMPTPGRVEVVNWLFEAWNDFPEEFVKNSFKNADLTTTWNWTFSRLLLRCFI